MEKYGFIYIWYDKKRKMFYIGRHWGHENDGYICSSNRMRDAYKRRPQDFKRRIIETNILKEFLVEKEQYWLNMIKPEELHKKYYNKILNSFVPSFKGFKHSEETKRKISKSINQPETLRKLREANFRQFQDSAQRESRRIKGLANWQDPEYREHMREAHRSKKQSIEHIQKRVLSNKKAYIAKRKRVGKNGRFFPPKSIELRQKISVAQAGRKWYNNGVTSIKSFVKPAGFVEGRGKFFKYGKNRNSNFGVL